MDYRPIPFYFINDTVDRKEIDRQMKFFKKSGVSGFFMHARCGLTEMGYGTREWFDDIRYITLKAAQYGLCAWLYDEDPYPSGHAGGRIAMEHPEFIARFISAQEAVRGSDGTYTEFLGECRPLRAYQVDDAGNTVADLTDCFGTVRPQWYGAECNFTYYRDTAPLRHYRSATYSPQIIFRAKNIPVENKIYLVYTKQLIVPNRFGHITDILNRDCVDLFIKYAYKPYADAVCDQIPHNVPGIFTDEPTPSGQFPPWTPELEQQFYREHGYRLEDNYFRLYFGSDERSLLLRRDYYRTASAMFSINYVKALKDYSNSRGLKFTGHFVAEDLPHFQVLKGTCVYDDLWHTDIPGFDVICGEIGTRHNPSLIFGAKSVSSVARQKGSEYALCELFAVNPYNFGTDSMLKIADWTYAMGLNILVPHAFCYGYSGFRKRDAGKSFFFQDPDFAVFPQFAQYADNTGRFVSQGRATANTLVLYPDWLMAAVGNEDREKCYDLETVFLRIISALTQNHIDFDIVSCKKLLESPVLDKITIGNMTYDNIVCLPSDCPSMKPINQYLNNTGAKVFYAKDGNPDIQSLKKSASFTLLRGIFTDCGDLITFRRQCGDDILVFIYNTSTKECVFETDAVDAAYVYDGTDGKYLSVQPQNGSIRLNIEGCRALMLLFSSKNIQTKGEYVLKRFPDKVFACEANPQWDYYPPIDTQAQIFRYDIEIEYEDKKLEFKDVEHSVIGNIYGADLLYRTRKTPRPPYDTAIYNTANYPVNAVYTARFTGGTARTMLIEGGETFLGECEVYLNGVKLDLQALTPKIVYDYRNQIVDVSHAILQNENIFKVVFKDAGEGSGINSPIYFY